MKKIIVSENLINDLILYIENMEVKIDEEWGNCRNLQKLVSEQVMPDIYYELKTLKK